MSGHWSAWQAARVEVAQQDEAKKHAKDDLPGDVVQELIDKTSVAAEQPADLPHRTAGPAVSSHELTRARRRWDIRRRGGRSRLDTVRSPGVARRPVRRVVKGFGAGRRGEAAVLAVSRWLGRAPTLTNGRFRTSVAGMAKRTRVELLDDLDGSPAQESVMFGLDGLTFEIDLSAGNAAVLRESLARYVDAARRIRFERFVAGGRARTPVQRRPVADPERLAAIRGWAAAQGHEVKDRGRISAGVVAAYEEAQRTPPTSADPPKRTRRGKAAPAARSARRRP